MQTPRVRDNRESNALKMRLNEAGDEKLGWLGGSEERGFPSQTLSQAQTKVGGTKCKHFRSLFAFLWHFVSASALGGVGVEKWGIFALPAGIRLRSASHIYLSRVFPLLSPELLCFLFKFVAFL